MSYLRTETKCWKDLSLAKWKFCLTMLVGNWNAAGFISAVQKWGLLSRYNKVICPWGGKLTNIKLEWRLPTFCCAQLSLGMDEGWLMCKYVSPQYLVHYVYLVSFFTLRFWNFVLCTIEIHKFETRNTQYIIIFISISALLYIQIVFLA